MKKILCLILVLTLGLTVLAGCSAQGSPVGTWEGNLDISPAVRQLLGDMNLGDDFPVSDFPVSIRITFEKDGSFSLQADQAQLETALSGLIEDLEAGLLEMLQAKLQEQNLGVAIDKLLGMSGMTTEDLTKKLREQVEKSGILEKLTEGTSLSGTYQTVGDKLFLNTDPEKDGADAYIRWSVEEDTLTLDEQIGTIPLIADNPIFAALPLELHRAA